MFKIQVNLEHWRCLAIEEAPIYYSHVLGPHLQDIDLQDPPGDPSFIDPGVKMNYVFLVLSTEVGEEFVRKMVAPIKGSSDDQLNTQGDQPLMPDSHNVGPFSLDGSLVNHACLCQLFVWRPFQRSIMHQFQNRLGSWGA